MEPNKDILEHIRAKQKPEVDPAYFEQFQAKMLEEIKKHPTTGSRGKTIYLRPVLWLSAAAAVVALVFGIRLFMQDPKTNFASVSQEEIETYLDEHEKESVWEVVEPEETQEIASVPTPAKQHEEDKEKNIELASTEGFVSSAQLLDELSTDEIYQYIESEDFDLEELDYTQF